MTDTTTATTTAPAATGAEGGEADKGGGDGFAPITSQADLNRIVQQSVTNATSRFADYDALKAAAEKADQLAATNADLAKRVGDFEAAKARDALVAKVAKATGVDAGIVANLRGDSEDDLKAAAAPLAERLKVTAPYIAAQAQRPDAPPADELREFKNSLFG